MTKRKAKPLIDSDSDDEGGSGSDIDSVSSAGRAGRLGEEIQVRVGRAG